MYLNGNSTKEISDAISVTTRQVRNVLRQRDVQLDGRRRTGGYKVNIDFFKEWTNEMAYVLGFVVTDGCISGNTLSISQKHPDILHRINSAMNSNYKVRKVPNSYGNYVHTLNIHRKSIVEGLRALGITSNKAMTVPFPNVPDEYMPHFIRGVIDGDGWIHPKGYVANVTGASKDFAHKLHKIFNERGYNGRITQEGHIYRVFVSGKGDVLNLAKWLYEELGELYLPRKMDRFFINAKSAA